MLVEWDLIEQVVRVFVVAVVVLFGLIFVFTLHVTQHYV